MAVLKREKKQGKKQAKPRQCGFCSVGVDSEAALCCHNCYRNAIEGGVHNTMQVDSHLEKNDKHDAIQVDSPQGSEKGDAMQVDSPPESEMGDAMQVDSHQESDKHDAMQIDSNHQESDSELVDALTLLDLREPQKSLRSTKK
ncbi:hypothetical protein HD806DRAFT_520122 [Xylariaceae sp. AK1471]|nr:hypothetical protein HD806DRAFT_520122 [Xylariaceae sp. AK1471]